MSEWALASVSGVGVGVVVGLTTPERTPIEFVAWVGEIDVTVGPHREERREYEPIGDVGGEVLDRAGGRDLADGPLRVLIRKLSEIQVPVRPDDDPLGKAPTGPGRASGSKTRWRPRWL